MPRTAEAADITDGLTRLPARVQLIMGAAGVGKTVLASALAAEVPHRTVVPVIALAELAGVPLGAFGPVLARFGLSSEPERAVPALMSAIGGAAERHLLLVDDIPRLDDVSAAAVYQLVRAFGVPTVATARLGEGLPAAIQRMVDEGLTVRHDLEGLTTGEVAELLDRRFAARVSYADVLRLSTRTSGNPLYLRVLVERAQQSGRVRPEGDTIRIDEGDAPSDLVNAMATRLADLTEEQRRVLRLAALLQPVDRGILAATPQEALLVATLEERGLVASELGTDRLRLTHPLIAEGLAHDDNDAASAVDEAVRRLRGTGDDRDRLLSVRLQMQGAGSPPIDELAWAAGYAYGMGDLTLAADLAGALLQRDADRANRCAALTTLASTQSLLGEHAAAERAFAQAEQLAREPEELALIAVRRGEHLSYRRYDLAGAVAQAERIRARINAESDVLDDSLKRWDASLDVIAGMPLLGRVAFRVNPELAIRSAILLVVSRSTSGDLAAARSAINELSRIQEQIGQVDPLAAAALGFARFVELICAGRVKEAAAYVESRRIDADDGVGIYTMLLGNLRQCGGRLAEAERLTILAVDQLRWRDGLGLLGVALGYQASVVAKQGRIAEARRLLDAMTPAQRSGRNAYIQVAEAEAWVRAHSGNLDGAVEAIEAAVGRGSRGSAFLAALACCIPIRLGYAERAAELLQGIHDRAPAELEIVACIRDLAVALRDRDLDALPGVLSRVEASGQEPTVLDAITLALRMRPPAELRRKLELTMARIASTVDEAPFQRGAPPLLSPRELEVALAASARERSKEIAERLGTSPRTVDTQLQSAFRKLGVSSRDGLRAALAEVGLLDPEG